MSVRGGVALGVVGAVLVIVTELDLADVSGTFIGVSLMLAGALGLAVSAAVSWPSRRRRRRHTAVTRMYPREPSPGG